MGNLLQCSFDLGAILQHRLSFRSADVVEVDIDREPREIEHEVLDAESGALVVAHDVGVAPYDVVVAGDRTFVSNWGGPRPDAHSVVGPAGRGTTMRVDARGIASEGSLSIVEPVLREDALASAALDLSALDLAPEDLLSRILWRAARGTEVPYPEWAISPGADDDY